MSYRHTAADVKAILARNEPKKSKFGNKKVVIDNIGFDSKREGAHYEQLKMMLKSDLIRDLEVHPAFKIKVNDIEVCEVVLDFVYKQYDIMASAWKPIFEDLKGKDNAYSQLKRKLVEAMYGFKVTLVK